MRNLIIAAVIAAAPTVVACSAAHAGEENLGVGSEITFHAGPNPYNADIYGCYDLGNTQELEQQRANHPGFIGSPAGMQFDQMTVTRYVAAHGVDNSSHSPKFFSNVCLAISSEERPERYKVAKTFDWPGGGPRLLCLDQMDKFDLGPTPEQVAKGESGIEPVCWWVNLDRAPALVRLRNGPAAAQRGTITDR